MQLRLRGRTRVVRLKRRRACDRVEMLAARMADLCRAEVFSFMSESAHWLETGSRLFPAPQLAAKVVGRFLVRAVPDLQGHRFAARSSPACSTQYPSAKAPAFAVLCKPRCCASPLHIIAAWSLILADSCHGMTSRRSTPMNKYSRKPITVSRMMTANSIPTL
jgi:hypothetical protein